MVLMPFSIDPRLFKPGVGRPYDKQRLDEFYYELDKIGQVSPVTINEANEIIDGHHRVKAAIALNMKTILVVKIPNDN